jgi:hypothetical protein
MTKAQQNTLSLIFGILFLAAILTLVSYFPCPSKVQVNVFKIVLAIAAGACAAIIPGFFDFQYQSMVKAGGALGVFALVFLVNPAGIEQEDNCNCSLELRGKVVINGIPAKEVSVRCYELKDQDETDVDGDFRFKTCRDFVPLSCSFMLTYKGHTTYIKPQQVEWKSLVLKLDTSTKVVAVDKSNVKFSFDNIANTSINYGGSPYCNYQLNLSDIKFYLSLDELTKQVNSSNLTLKAKEETVGACPYEGVGMNTHVYNMSSFSFKEENLSIFFVPDQLNNPNCSLLFSGKKIGSRIQGTFTLKRIDMPESKLTFEKTIYVSNE